MVCSIPFPLLQLLYCTFRVVLLSINYGCVEIDAVGV